MENGLLNGLKLKRIRYGSSGGSMNYHSEFEIEANSSEVIRTCYWNDNCFSRDEEETPQDVLAAIDNSYRTSEDGKMTVREHIPMNSELWDALCEELEYLKEQLRPVEKIKMPIRQEPEMQVLDGGDYQRLYLTWEDTGGEKTDQYYCPSGRRWWSVIQIICEMSRPVGRDLQRVGETEMTEMFLKAPKYSYQITPIRNAAGYYFFVYGDSSDLGSLSQEQWITVRDYLKTLDLTGFKKGKYENKYYLRLKYNDGIDKNLEIDKDTAEQIRSYIRSSLLEK